MSLHICHVWATKCKGGSSRTKTCILSSLEQKACVCYSVRFQPGRLCVTFLEIGQSHTVISQRPAGSSSSALSTNSPNNRSAVGGHEGNLFISSAGFFTHSPVNMCGRSWSYSAPAAVSGPSRDSRSIHHKSGSGSSAKSHGETRWDGTVRSDRRNHGKDYWHRTPQQHHGFHDSTVSGWIQS